MKQVRLQRAYGHRFFSIGTALFLISALAASAGEPGSTRKRPPLDGAYRATAYAQTGITASGEWTHRHVVAADPDVLPIGSRIKIRRAGRYSGEYVVADTGAKIQGRRLDIYMPDVQACKKFGTKLVRVKVIEVGAGTQASAKEADHVVKQEVATDVAKKVVGNAATQDDWVKANAQKTAPQPNPHR